MKSITDPYAKSIRALRRSRGMTLEDMAARADIPLRTYKEFEYTGDISLKRFDRILKVLGRGREVLAALEVQDLPESPAAAIRALKLKRIPDGDRQR